MCTPTTYFFFLICNLKFSEKYNKGNYKRFCIFSWNSMSIAGRYRACTLLTCGEGNLSHWTESLLKNPHMEKFPTKHHVEVIWILHCTQHLIRSKLYQMMTWLYSVGILPAHKETTIQPFPLNPSTLRSTRNQMMWAMSLKIHSL